MALEFLPWTKSEVHIYFLKHLKSFSLLLNIVQNENTN